MPEESTRVLPDSEPNASRSKKYLRSWLLGFIVVAIMAVLAAGFHSWKRATSPTANLLERAKHGETAAAFTLGNAYEKGTGGYAKDSQQAIRWYMQAAEAGDARAQNNLGLMYWRGDGVTKDYAIALNWLRKSAEQGDKKAEWNIARAFLLGLGVPESFPDAITWGKKAAEQGDATAQGALCAMYTSGRGVEKDPTLGYAWCLVSKASGNEKARNLVDKLGTVMSPAQMAEAQSLASSWWSNRSQKTPMPEHSKDFSKLPHQPNINAGIEQPSPLRKTSPHLGGVLSTSGCESGHWLESVSGDGSIIGLEDGSVWRVSDVDAIDSQLWLPTEEILVCDGKLVNTDATEAAEAVRVK